MVTMEQIQEFGNRIGEEFHPERVILFGSYARGAAGPASDVDLLIILPFRGHPAYKSVKMRLKIDVSFPVDLVLRTPREIRRRVEMGDPFILDILEEGKVLYEAPHRQALDLRTRKRTKPAPMAGGAVTHLRTPTPI